MYLSRNLSSPFYNSYANNSSNPHTNTNISKQAEAHQYNTSSYNSQYNIPYASSNSSSLYPFKFNADHPSHHHHYHSSPIYNHASPYGSFNHGSNSLPGTGAGMQNFPYYPSDSASIAAANTAAIYRSSDHSSSSSNSPPSLSTSTLSSSASLSPTSISSISSGGANNTSTSNSRSVVTTYLPTSETHILNANSTDRYLLQHSADSSSISSSSSEVSSANLQQQSLSNTSQHFNNNAALNSSFEANRILTYMDYILH
jgi:hypothetical protein